jgi:hypothetical protein
MGIIAALVIGAIAASWLLPRLGVILSLVRRA